MTSRRSRWLVASAVVLIVVAAVSESPPLMALAFLVVAAGWPVLRALAKSGTGGFG